MADFYTPQEISKNLVTWAEKKKDNSAMKLIVLGILAGAYIGFAAHLATTIATGSTEWLGAKKFLTGAVFSFGLMLVIIPGSELWTGNNLMFTGLYEKKVRFTDILRNWVFVYIGNLIGSVMLAYIIAGQTGLLDGRVGASAINFAYQKINFAPEGISHNTAYFFRAIGCNWLVCLAVLLAMAAKDITGKIFGIFFPIMAFVASGFEHSIANMYFIPAGIIAKKFSAAQTLTGLPAEALDSVNWVNMWTDNIIAVTAGNLVGGSFFVATIYWWLYVRSVNKD